MSEPQPESTVALMAIVTHTEGFLSQGTSPDPVLPPGPPYIETGAQ